MYREDSLCGISKVSFEIPHKISYQYIEINQSINQSIERYEFYTKLKFYKLWDLRAPPPPPGLIFEVIFMKNVKHGW